MSKMRNAIDQIEFMRNLLAFLLVAAFISVLPVLTFVIIPESNKEVITYMVGQLSGMATTVLGFYFINKVGQDAIDAKRSENTGKLADLAHAAIESSKPAGEQVSDAVEETAQAAVNKADEIKENGK